MGVWYYASKHALMYQLRHSLSIQNPFQWKVGVLGKYINFGTFGFEKLTMALQNEIPEKIIKINICQRMS